MPPRRLLRIVLSGFMIVVIWVRIVREWRYFSRGWLIGAIAVSTLLLVVVVFELVGSSGRWARQKDKVPKHPLGLQ